MSLRVLGRALYETGEQLPVPWNSLPIRPTPGNLIIGLAAPGVGKSMLGLTWALELAKKRYPVLVISIDTDLNDQAIRTVSMLTGVHTAEVRRDLEKWSYWLDTNVDLPIRWSDHHMGADDFEKFIAAEVEYLGQPPALVVVDVAGDLLEGEENVGNVRHIFQTLKKAARQNKCVVLALHHVKRGPAASGTKTVMLDDGLYGGEQIAQIVLGMWKEGPHALQVAVLKNRMGPAAADGSMTTQLFIDYERALVRDQGRLW